MIIRPARPGDVDEVMRLRAGASRWLASIGSDQWARPWPSEQEMRAAIGRSVDAGETWMAVEHDRIVGTLAVDGQAPPPGLWTPEEEAQPVRYVHRVIIDRSVAGHGIGASLLDWAAALARKQGAEWLRADVWTTNTALHDYYRRLGWTHVRTVVRGDYPSGALFQLAP